MVALLLVGVVVGFGSIMQMIAWCVETWKQGDMEDKVARFEENSRMMSKEAFKLGE